MRPDEGPDHDDPREQIAGLRDGAYEAAALLEELEAELELDGPVSWPASGTSTLQGEPAVVVARAGDVVRIVSLSSEAVETLASSPAGIRMVAPRLEPRPPFAAGPLARRVAPGEIVRATRTSRELVHLVVLPADLVARATTSKEVARRVRPGALAPVPRTSRALAVILVTSRDLLPRPVAEPAYCDDVFDRALEEWLAEPEPEPDAPEPEDAPVARAGRRFRPGALAARMAPALGIAVGVLLVADGVLTIVWQEPFTGLYTEHEQRVLRDQLLAVEADFARLPRAPRITAAEQLAADARRFARRARFGAPMGRLSIPKLGVRFVMVQGVGADSLAKGPGHYATTSWPGLGGTTGIAGHRTTYLAPFRHIDQLRRGDPIVVRMPYGRFTYHVEKSRIVTPDHTEVLKPVGGAPRLVLTSCNPVYSDAQRLVVFARLDRSRRV